MPFGAEELAAMARHPSGDAVEALVAEVERQQRVIDAARELLERWRSRDEPEEDKPGQLTQAMLAARADELAAVLDRA